MTISTPSIVVSPVVVLSVVQACNVCAVFQIGGRRVGRTVDYWQTDEEGAREGNTL